MIIRRLRSRGGWSFRTHFVFQADLLLSVVMKHGFRPASTPRCVWWSTIVTITLTCSVELSPPSQNQAPVALGWPTQLALSVGQISELYWASRLSTRRGLTVGANGRLEPCMPCMRRIVQEPRRCGTASMRRAALTAHRAWATYPDCHHWCFATWDWMDGDLEWEGKRLANEKLAADKGIKRMQKPLRTIPTCMTNSCELAAGWKADDGNG